VIPPTVQDKARIIANGKTAWYARAREILLSLFEHGLTAVNPYLAVNRHIAMADGKITVRTDSGELAFPLEDTGKIYVVGGGKAAVQMAVAMEELLGNRIEAGFVNAPDKLLQLDPPKLNRIKAIGASHPIPNQAGVDGVKKMIELSENARSKDLVFCLISGGGSALMPQPAGSITLEDKQVLNRLLIQCGATINEINTVRKHVSMVKGGWLARHFQPARVIGLILSDVVGDDLSTIGSGPTVPDHTTFSDSVAILEKYGLIDKIPMRIRKYMILGMRDEHLETPKAESKMFQNVQNVMIGSARTAAEEIKVKAREFKDIGTVHILTSRLEGEAAEIGQNLHALITNIFDLKTRVKIDAKAGFFNGKSFRVDYGSGRGENRCTLLLLTGETTVTIKGQGTGGRNQEMLLAFLNKMDAPSKGKFGIISCGMDGIEGNSPAAGALIDDQSRERALQLSLNLKELLENNDSYAAFSRLGDAIITGPTGTNVNDLTMVLLDQPVKKIELEE